MFAATTSARDPLPPRQEQMASVSTAPKPRCDTSSRIRTRTGPDPLSDMLAHPELGRGVAIGLLRTLLDAYAALTGRSLAAATDLRVVATSRIQWVWLGSTCGRSGPGRTQ